MRNAAQRSPEREAVVESIRILVLELYRPCSSAIDCFVNAKICCVRSNGHQIRDISAESLHIAELQRFGARDHIGCPRLSTVSGDGERAIATACPDHLRVYRPD